MVDAENIVHDNLRNRIEFPSKLYFAELLKRRSEKKCNNVNDENRSRKVWERLLLQ